MTLSASASDNSGGSGVREVRFSAKWNDQWHGIGNDSSSPYSINWDWCAAGVPNGDVELGLEVWDNANNQWVYSDHYSNIHVTKSYSCSSGTGDYVVTSVSYPANVASGQSFTPQVQVCLSGSASMSETNGDMLRNTDGNLYGAFPHVAVEGTVVGGQCYTFVFYDPITAPSSSGSYTSLWQLWVNGSYVTGTEVTIQFTVGGGGGTVTLWEHANYQGASQSFSGIGKFNVNSEMNDKTSSVQMPNGWSVLLYEHSDQGGVARCFNGSQPDMTIHSFDNVVSSLEVFDTLDCHATAGNWLARYFASDTRWWKSG